MAYKYSVHPRHKNKAQLITIGESGEAVNLIGKAVTGNRLDADGQPYEVTIPAATQADLKAVYESGAKDVQSYPIVIRTETKASPAVAAKSNS